MVESCRLAERAVMHLPRWWVRASGVSFSLIVTSHIQSPARRSRWGLGGIFLGWDLIHRVSRGEMRGWACIEDDI